MLRDTFDPTVRPDTVTISADEYHDLTRASAQLDVLLTLHVNGEHLPVCLADAFAKERNIVKEANNG